MHNLNNNCHVYRASSRPQGQIKENKRHLNFLFYRNLLYFKRLIFYFFLISKKNSNFSYVLERKIFLKSVAG